MQIILMNMLYNIIKTTSVWIGKVFAINIILLFLLCLLLADTVSAQKAKPPIMGWSSWNQFRTKIDEQMIREQADAMISSGLYAAGYRFINIDDGYFGGRDSTGKLFADQKKFPTGLGELTQFIHSKGLKAGIYTDAGRNTCSSVYDNDPNGHGVGIYGHLIQDSKLFFNDWKFDFLKVDWCGAEQMNLNEQFEYLKIIEAVKGIDCNIVFNICRWKFPGEWAIKKADSWRISGDIDAKFSTILQIIDANRSLYNYASPGHYNDMDMLQVGRGMSYNEDKTHFSMWCILGSPLLAGNDLRNMTKQTIEILTNKEIIALDQDKDFIQGRRAFGTKEIEVWTKTLLKNNAKAIAIMNRGEKSIRFKLNPRTIAVSRHARMRDLWLHKELGVIGDRSSFLIPKHGIVVLKVY